MKKPLIYLLLVFTLAASGLRAQEAATEDYVRQNYNKREVMITMRDGVKLFTSIYEPRGKYRQSLEHPEPFQPGEVTLVRFTLPDVSHTFLPGHQLQVQVQSSWFPLVDRNPQTFTNIYQAKDTDFQPSTIRVWHASDHASRITIPVVKH